MRVAPVLVSAVLCSAIALTGCTRQTSGAAVPPPGLTALPQSDEDRIAELVDRFEQAWNDREFAQMRELMCAQMRGQREFGEDSLREARSESGRLDLEITDLEIGDATATAVIENHGEDPDDIAFEYEGGEWKWCEF
ncbi:uncharacterized protein RMCC_4828 [Mycolicibacterium canariasense]|uniref:DUF4878 domain-containing protein n=1 Tax=Mycolicibacterium canariasense TaxID=228230 RepID=A0A124E2T9_MYCCR|nr:hypothetical protein AWB94_04365 [Mycolicibacterium canariasense]GAS97863.1 uncharacterized protein RMCC_4828 [Mycolicibacterium canariasense]